VIREVLHCKPGPSAVYWRHRRALLNHRRWGERRDDRWLLRHGATDDVERGAPEGDGRLSQPRRQRPAGNLSPWGL